MAQGVSAETCQPNLQVQWPERWRGTLVPLPQVVQSADLEKFLWELPDSQKSDNQGSHNGTSGVCVVTEFDCGANCGVRGIRVTRNADSTNGAAQRVAVTRAERVIILSYNCEPVLVFRERRQSFEMPSESTPAESFR